jgi:hypothetical protein
VSLDHAGVFDNHSIDAARLVDIEIDAAIQYLQQR